MIKFLVPQFLFALAALAIPIIIHLFNFRKFKKVFFTNVRFLKELKEETTNRSRIKHLLVLASRLLAITFLVFAFAQPVIPHNNLQVVKAENAVSIYVDNSFTMDGISKEGTLLEVAKKKAHEIALAYPPSTRFQILTNDFEAVHQRLISREEFSDVLDQIKISPSSRKLSEVIARQQEVFHNLSNTSKLSFILSDFQESSTDFQACQTDTSLRVTLLPLVSQSNANLFVDSCWFTSPVVQLNRAAELNVRLHNSGEKEADNVPVKLSINGTQRSVASIPVRAGESATTTMNFTVTEAGWQKAEVNIMDHPITFDDAYYFSFEVKNKIVILSVNDNGVSPYLKALFGTDPLFGFNNAAVSQIDYSLLPQQNLVILNDLPSISSGLASELAKYLNSGGELLIFPDSGADINSYNQFLQSINGDAINGINSNSDRVEKLDRNHPLFKDVFERTKNNESSIDYPVAVKHFEVNQTTRSNRQVLMKLQGGSPFLLQYTVGKGTVYLFTVPLKPGFSNLSRHAVFVPALYQMALLSVKQHDISFTLGADEALNLSSVSIAGDATFHLVNAAKKFDVIPNHRVTASGILVAFNKVVKEAGNYDLLANQQTASSIAFNYNRAESYLKSFTPDQITNQLQQYKLSNMQLMSPEIPDLTKKLNQLAEGISLWKYCIMLVLLFLLIEVLLLRFWKA